MTFSILLLWAFQKELLDEFEKDPMTVEINSVVAKIHEEIGKKAKEAQRKAEANGDNEIKTQQTKTELLTYREKVSNILRKVQNTNYKKPSRILRALEKTAKSLEENGVITKFYISENSNGEQITNWVINENFSY